MGGDSRNDFFLVIAIIPISGFSQRNRDVIGMRSHWVKDLRPLSSSKVFVHPPVAWHTCPKDILGTIEDVEAHIVIIVAYSWGCGYGATRLAEAAVHRGKTVALVTSCDGVWRNTAARVFGWMFAPFALTTLPKIKFPKEVRRIVGVRQSSVIPAGHKIMKGDDEVKVEWLNTTHNAIDEHPEWRRISREAIERAIQEFQESN